MPAPPLPPPRTRAASNPGLSGEAALWHSLGGLHSDVSEIKVGLANVQQTLAQQNAGTRNQTLQIIAGCVATCVTAVIGARAVAPTPEPTKTVTVMTAYDRALEGCKQIQSEADRVACIVKISHDAAGVPLR